MDGNLWEKRRGRNSNCALAAKQNTQKKTRHSTNALYVCKQNRTETTPCTQKTNICVAEHRTAETSGISFKKRQGKPSSAAFACAVVFK